MNALDIKKEWILNQEHYFARQLAGAVLPLPKLNIWMILIPIILIFHIFRQNKIIRDRKTFIGHYLLSRKRALDAAFESVRGKYDPDIERIVLRAVDLPFDALPAYRAWIEILVNHFLDLLKARGNSYPDLIRNLHTSRSDYLLFLNLLNQKERSLNQAVKKDIPDAAEIVNETIARIEAHSARLRRELAEQFFPFDSQVV